MAENINCPYKQEAIAITTTSVFALQTWEFCLVCVGDNICQHEASVLVIDS